MEVTYINKQKFIAELEKLLAFMYEGDRDATLALYNDMFNEATDEEALIKQLVSPTKQAVIVARAYNAKERSIALGIKPQAAENGEAGVSEQPGELPDYAKVVGQIQEEVRQKQKQLADEAQICAQEFAAENAPAEETEQPETECSGDTPDEEHDETEIPADETESPADETGSEAEEAPKTDEAGSGEDEEAEPSADIEEPEETSEASVDEEAEKNVDIAPSEAEPVDAPAAQEPAEPSEYVRKPRVFLMILYIIAAIPVGLVCIAVMLIPALIFLALAAASIGLGVFVTSCAFGGLTIFADIMIVIGAALVLFAIGLLFLWTFIWFIGGAIAGFVRGVIRLGGKWCYKEVAAE